MAPDTLVFVLEWELLFQVARKHKRSTTPVSNKLTMITTNTLPGHRGVGSEGLAEVGAYHNEGGGLTVAPFVELAGPEVVL